MAILEMMETLRRQTKSPAAKPEPQAAPSRGTANPGSRRLRLKLPARPQIFTGLDIGTTKVCAIIGEITPSGQVTILGVASTPSQGLRRGVVINLEETVESVRTAMRKAEEIAQVSVRDVFVGIAGGHIKCHQTAAEIDVANPERGITKVDIRRAIERAVNGHNTVEREVIDTIPQRFCIDDGWIVDPEGCSSRKLGVEVLMVTAAVTSAQNIIRSVAQAGYRVSAIYLEPLASSLAILTEREKELGVAMIDIGGGTSDIAIWVDGAVRYTDVVPLGGDAVTEDIAHGLKISRFDAENLKKRHGHCVPADIDEMETIEVPVALTGKTERAPRRFLAEIIEARVSEILELALAKIDKLPVYERVYGGIVLTGGASLQAGLPKLSERIFRKPCKISFPTGLSGLSSVVSSPIYSTGVGLVLYGLEHERERSMEDASAFHWLIRKFRDYVDWYG